ncbi:hypothetical protein O7627_10445 [Solwaraspora sp. WMMD1047]|uniref:hypothetical protein n=1 Tax=Solwaraspora sp. WMMD1047 TaxID=3016102 RepID=UPI00241778A3|nr:hypothetical protein [Solwaraspora sp. WMMD1047]MDG4829721.1 hypothetical protein [Solwaraspora sp. WMMD1047]
MEASQRWYRPAPNGLLLAGSVVILLGYLLPWFKTDEQKQWWWSGWNYLTLSSGGGWTWWAVFLLVVAIGASCWAGRSLELAQVAVGAATAAMVFASAVVAVSLGGMPERSSINWVGELPFGIGLPLMAIGFGTVVAALAGARRRQP